MGQATVDLPDPMQLPAAPATAGTDELLAQLAGNEIERLLAETQTERPAEASAAAPPAPSAAVASAPPASESPSPQPAAAAVAPAAVVGPSAAEASANPPQNLTSQLDALFDSLGDASAVPAVAPAPVPGSAAQANASAAAALADEPVATFEAPADIATSADELKALAEPIAANSYGGPAAGSAPDAIANDPEDARPPLLVRLLEILNAPLASCSEPARQAMGKIAIVTLLNAIAVLVYALVFRRH